MVRGGGGKRGGDVDWGFKVEGRGILSLTVQKDGGKKKMLTKAKSLAFSPSLVDALHAITALALNSCEKKANISPSHKMAETLGENKKTCGVSQSHCGRQFLPEVLALIFAEYATVVPHSGIE